MENQHVESTLASDFFREGAADPTTQFTGRCFSDPKPEPRTA